MQHKYQAKKVVGTAGKTGTSHQSQEASNTLLLHRKGNELK